MSKENPIIETIRHLMDARDKAVNIYEANTAAAHIHRLLQTNNLTTEEIETHGDDDDMTQHIEDFVTEGGTKAKSVRSWKQDLAYGVGKACFCEMVLVHDAATTCFHYFGRKTNVEVAVYLYRYLEGEIQRLYLEERNKTNAALGRRHWRSWKEGCVNRVCQRLREQNRSFMSQSQETKALVCQRQKEAIAFRDSVFPRLSTASKSNVGVDGNGYEAGCQAGNAISLRRAVSQSGDRVLLLE